MVGGEFQIEGAVPTWLRKQVAIHDEFELDYVRRSDVHHVRYEVSRVTLVVDSGETEKEINNQMKLKPVCSGVPSRSAARGDRPGKIFFAAAKNVIQLAKI